MTTMATASVVRPDAPGVAGGCTFAGRSGTDESSLAKDVPFQVAALDWRVLVDDDALRHLFCSS